MFSDNLEISNLQTLDFWSNNWSLISSGCFFCFFFHEIKKYELKGNGNAVKAGKAEPIKNKIILLNCLLLKKNYHQMLPCRFLSVKKNPY